MGHLTREALARLVDSSPVSEEQEHLDSCPLCAAELVALREQTESLGSLPDLRPPSGDWEALEARLVSEGLVHDGLKAGRWLQSISPAWMQLAAALILFFFGVGLGTRWTGTPESSDIPVLTDAGARSLAVPVMPCAVGGLQPISHLHPQANASTLLRDMGHCPQPC